MTANTYLSPAFQLTVDEQDITTKVASRLISLHLTECGDEESDQLDITLSDADGRLAIPSRGTPIQVHIGWANQGLVDKGTFIVDEVEHCGAPDQLILRARTVNLIDSFRQIQEISFHDTTLGNIIDIIAFKNNLHSGIAKPLRDVVVSHLDQTRESDAAFLRRLGKKYDATATVKNNTLLFISKNQRTTVSGQPFPLIHITRNQGDHHRYHSAERDSYTGVRAFWHDANHVIRRSVIAGSAGNSKRLRTTYATEADARQAAIAEWQRIQRGLATFELTLAIGNPALLPSSPVQVTGFKEIIDNVEWQVTKVAHYISKNGFTSRIEMETKTQAADIEQEPQTDPDQGVTGILAHWRDTVSKKSGTVIAPRRGAGKNQQPAAGANLNPKTLSQSNGHKDVYSSKASAQRAADLAWMHIVETRAILEENKEIEDQMVFNKSG